MAQEPYRKNGCAVFIHLLFHTLIYLFFSIAMYWRGPICGKHSSGGWSDKSYTIPANSLLLGV